MNWLPASQIIFQGVLSNATPFFFLISGFWFPIYLPMKVYILSVFKSDMGGRIACITRCTCLQIVSSAMPYATYFLKPQGFFFSNAPFCARTFLYFFNLQAKCNRTASSTYAGDTQPRSKYFCSVCACMVFTFRRLGVNRVCLPILLVVS